MYKLAVFDLDGTLVDSILDLAAAVNYSLNKMGYSAHTIEEYRYFVGDGVMKLCGRVLPEGERTENNILYLHRLFTEYYEKNYIVNTKPYNNMENVLKSLKKNDVKLAVASNKPHEFTVKIIENLFESGMFDAISGNIYNVPIKPSPDILNYIIKQLNVNNEQTIMIGDSSVDILTAKNAGVKSIGCLWGFRTQNELESAGADYIAENPLEILKIIIKEL